VDHIVALSLYYVSVCDQITCQVVGGAITGFAGKQRVAEGGVAGQKNKA
jgi:hypothetical protein